MESTADIIGWHQDFTPRSRLRSSSPSSSTFLRSPLVDTLPKFLNVVAQGFSSPPLPCAQPREAPPHGRLMGLLLSCWLIVGTILIPGGFGRWNQLSYFVHPVTLIACQLFIVAKLLVRQLIVVLIFPFKALVWVVVFVFKQIQKSMTGLILLIVRVVEASVASGAEAKEEEYFEAPQTEDPARSVVVRNRWAGASSRKREFESYEEEFFPAVGGDEFPESFSDHGHALRSPEERRPRQKKSRKRDWSSFYNDEAPALPERHDAGIAGETIRERRRFTGGFRRIEGGSAATSPQVNRSASRDRRILTGAAEKIGESADAAPAEEQQDEVASALVMSRRKQIERRRVAIDESKRERAEDVVPTAEELPAVASSPPPVVASPREQDPFQEEYEKRMTWFDRVSFERNGEASELLRMLLGPSFRGRMETDIRRLQGTPYFDLLRSIENSLEMAYVGQTCLAWGALHHQYARARAIDPLRSFSGADDGVPCEQTIGKFKLFWELLERYLEAEKLEAGRRWSYSRSRLSAARILQVPEISGDERTRYGTPAVREVVDAVKKAIDVFWNFLLGDDRRSAGRLRRLLWTDPQAEDPRDLYDLDDIKKDFRKKEKQMERLLERTGRWWKAETTSPAGANRWVDPEAFFAAIELKLVGRVMRMAVISSQQMQWCKHQLDRLQIRRSRVLRHPQDNRDLFPYS